ncbi:MAG: hypothetical protein HY866_21920, partial [Chloroflexi bacterium]|nr:hypothetical protein [Chloroflexota bacterium]
SLVGVQSPRRTSYDVAAEPGYTLRTLPETGIGLNVPVTVSEGTRYRAEDVLIDAGMVGSFIASGYTAAPELEASATWHLSDKAPRLLGSITNTTGFRLQEAVLLVKGEARELGTLEPDQTRSFDITLGPQDPGPLSLGSSSYRYAPNAYSTWGYSAYIPGGCFNYQGVPLTIPDVMRGKRFSCSSGNVSDTQQEIRRRYKLLAALIVDRELSGGRGAGVYLFAWANTPLIPVGVDGKNYSTEDTTLYIFDLPVDVRSDTAVVEIPPALTTWAVTAKDDPATLLEISPNSFQLTDATQAAFEFRPMPEMRLEAVEDLSIRFQGRGPLQVELWNWERNFWVPVQLDPNSDTTIISRAARFAGPEQEVHVRVLSNDNTQYTQVEYIKIGYRGRLPD